MGSGASSNKYKGETVPPDSPDELEAAKAENDRLKMEIKQLEYAALTIEEPASPGRDHPHWDDFDVVHTADGVHMECPVQDPHLHPDIAIYGGKVCEALPFPAETASRVVAVIDLANISANCKAVQQIAARTNRKIMGVVKANAFGHGATAVAHMLVKCNGMDFLSVASVNEGIELRLSGLPSSVRIFVWMTHRSEWTVCADYRLDICIISVEMGLELRRWAREAFRKGELKCPIRVHVLLNTGVSRIEPEGIGFQMYSEEDEGACNQQQADTLKDVIKRFDDDVKTEFVGIVVKLGDSEQQLTRFKQVVDTVRAANLRIPMILFESSQTLLLNRCPDSYVKEILEGPDGTYGTVGYCRTGGAMYSQRPQFDFLKPCITLKAQIRHVHLCKKGCPVGYERSWCASEDTVIATLAVGFADGYAREFSNAGSYGKCGMVTINGFVCPIVGKVCMDMMMVSCGGLDTPSGQAPQVGGYAILFGKDGPDLQTVANVIGTSQSDITCDFTRRIERVYTRPVQPQEGYFVCTSVKESLHPEVLYGGTPVGSVPFPNKCDVRVQLVVDLAAISHNASMIQQVTARTGRKTIGIVKANSYGMGAVAVSHMLYRVNGFDFFGVASINEAIELRMSGIPESVHILVLGASTPSEWKSYSYYDLDIGVQSVEAAEELVAWATQQLNNNSLKNPFRVHVLLNTGMSRIGLQTYSPGDPDTGTPETYEDEVAAVVDCVKMIVEAPDEAVQFYALMTHMCDAHKENDFTQTQFTRYHRVVTAIREQGIRIPMIHMENSEATLEGLITAEQVHDILRGPGEDCDTVGYCRSGGGMYGQRNFDFLRPTCTLKAQIRDVHTIANGRVIATVAAGYADGFSRSFGNSNSEYGKGGNVGIHGQICPIASRISMDALTVDCGTKDSIAGSKVKVGDYAVLFGKGGPSLKDVANSLTTAQSDITCDLTRRPERYYINAPAPRELVAIPMSPMTQCENARARNSIRLAVSEKRTR
mmetsp:Transcript_13332/g.35766  ORF Transcript_13332/g.35766 Transcript_13332/m.35766 type:complete len:993 (+) Transcript_13332:74-3052(+)